MYGMLFKGEKDIEEEKLNKVKEAFHVLDNFLERQDSVAGRNLTIADLATIATVTTAETIGFKIDDYKNVTEWAERIKNCAPRYRLANGEGLELLKSYLPPPQPQSDDGNKDDE